jgi:alkyldihydroxyacetonephosphate synthase
MLDAGVLVETLETATYWSGLRRTYDAVSAALLEELGEPALVLCHVSHVYETGASLYFTVATPEGDDALARWADAKRAAMDAIVDTDATITHHHAVGTDHRPWLEDEIGAVGVSVLRAVKSAVDPDGIMNPGVLIA